MSDRPPQRRGQERRARLVESAAELTLERGIAALSHRAVAEAAGVPLGSTTYYFSSLDDLRAAAVERLFAGDRARRAFVLDDGLAPEVGAADLGWRLIDLLIGIPRLDAPRQVALLYERIAEATRAPELAEVVRRSAVELESDVARLVAGTAWSGCEPAALVAVVDGRAIGWLAKGEQEPHALLTPVAADLERHRGS